MEVPVWEFGGVLSGLASVQEVKEPDWEKREVGLWRRSHKALADPTESLEAGEVLQGWPGLGTSG